MHGGNRFDRILMFVLYDASTVQRYIVAGLLWAGILTTIGGLTWLAIEVVQTTLS